MSIGSMPLVQKAHWAAQIFINNLFDLQSMWWYLREFRRLRRFKDIHEGQSCFIIGNGPSLNKMDLSRLRHHHTFGLNKIYLMFEKVDLNLSYHVAVNPLVIEQSKSEIEKLNCPSFLSYEAGYRVVKHLDHCYFIMTGGGPCSFVQNLQGSIWEGYTVTYVAMQIAYYMGFKEVYLIGVDHSFFSKGNPNEEQFLENKDLNHFHPDYFRGKHWHLPDLEGSEMAYHLAKFFYNRSGRAIYDATVEGKLQVFPKISYEDALRRCSRKLNK